MDSDNSTLGELKTGDVKITRVGPDAEPLDAGYELSPQQATFFKAETGVDDDDELRTHILTVQQRAYKIFPYMSIRSFRFLRLGIATQPEYQTIIKLGQERPDEILLDIGCCFGVDARKAVADGFPLKSVVATDLKKEFFNLGHDLFNTTQATYPISFVPGDAFDPYILQIVPPFDEPPSTERPDLTTLTSLNPLAGRCSVIFASNFFHLFSEENQFQLAKALAGLLSPRSGSMICGEHVGNSQKGIMQQELSGMKIEAFGHCPASWGALWDGGVFVKGKVRVNVKLELKDRGGGLLYERLQWSVVRL